MYDLHGQGIPIIVPIDQKQVGMALKMNSKVSQRLYKGYVSKMKKQIQSEISRGIATALPYNEIARNLHNLTNASLNNTMRIVRTEGHRIANASALDAQKEAQANGADIAKQWDATLDGATRPVHAELDGQVRGVEEEFEAAGYAVDAPGMFGDPAQDCNCRCALLQRAKWSLDESELETLQERAEYFGLDKTNDFDDFKEKYMNVSDSERVRSSTQKMNSKDTLEKGGKSSIIESTKHASERIESRGINKADISSAIKNPLHKCDVVVDDKGRKSIKYIGEDATVILNPETNKIITSWKTGKRIKKKYGKGD